MGIWGRLGNVVKSYINDSINDSGSTYKNSKTDRGSFSGDPDVDAAFDELNDFLKGSWQKAEENGGSGKGTSFRERTAIPEEVQKDFAELGLSSKANLAECKAAYKALLKTHHPDRHAQNSAAMKKATEKTARLNASYSRLEKWFKV